MLTRRFDPRRSIDRRLHKVLALSGAIVRGLLEFIALQGARRAPRTRRG